MTRLILALLTALKLYDALCWYIRLVETDVELAVFGMVAGWMAVGIWRDVRSEPVK